MLIKTAHQRRFARIRGISIKSEIIVRLVVALIAVWLTLKVVGLLLSVMALKRRETIKNSDHSVDRLVEKYKRELGGGASSATIRRVGGAVPERTVAPAEDVIIHYKRAYEDRLVLMQQGGGADRDAIELITSMVRFFHDLQWGSGLRIQELDAVLLQWHVPLVGGQGWARWVRSLDDHDLISAELSWAQWKEILTGVALVDLLVRDAQQKTSKSIQHLAHKLGVTEEIARASLSLLIGKLEEQSAHALLPQVRVVEHRQWGKIRESNPAKWAKVLLRLFWHRNGQVRAGATHLVICLKRAAKIILEVREFHRPPGAQAGVGEWLKKLELSYEVGVTLPSLAQIKKQYHVLTLRYHPDRVLGVEGTAREQEILTEKLTAIREAYEQLELLIKEENRLLEKIRFFSWEESNSE